MRLRFQTALLAAIAAAITASAAPDFTVYVSNERAGTVSVIDPEAQRPIAAIPVGKRPRGVHVSPDGKTLYVAVSGSPIMAPGAHPDRAEAPQPDRAADGIAIVDLGSRRVVRKLEVGSDPEQFAIGADGRTVFVSNEDETSASAWDIASGRNLFRAPVSDEPEGVALRPNAREVYVTCEAQGDVFILNADNGRKISQFRVRGRPRSVAFLPDGSRAYVPAEGAAEISVVDAGAHRVLHTIKIDGANVLPMCAIMAPDGHQLFVSTGRGNTVAFIDTATDRVVTQVPVGSRPWGIALSPDGTTLFAANGKSDDVSIIDVAARKEIGRINAGAGPWGVAVGPVPGAAPR